jgi:quaternary ammonium compound-resistance protein SugE
MAWIILVIAGLLEVGWAIGLKYTEGFTKPVPSVLTAACMVASVWLLGVAMKSLPVGTAYGVWVGVGAVGTVILGIVLFDEPAHRRAQAVVAGLNEKGRGPLARPRPCFLKR